MKKNLLIIILALISVASLVFGYTQKQKADEQEARAKEYSIMAEEEKRRAELQAELVLQQRKQAERIAKKAQEQMLRMQKEAELDQKNK
jgi:Flp pilus assembly protein TadB